MDNIVGQEQNIVVRPEIESQFVLGWLGRGYFEPLEVGMEHLSEV